MPEEQDAFYIAIQNPKDFRRELLGSSKNILQLLQRREELMELRARKMQLMFGLSEIMSEIRMLVNRLRKTVPITKLRNVPDLRIKQNAEKEEYQEEYDIEKKAKNKLLKEPRSHKPGPKQKMPNYKEELRPKDTRELERLRDELEMIEDQLKDIS